MQRLNFDQRNYITWICEILFPSHNKLCLCCHQRDANTDQRNTPCHISLLIDMDFSAVAIADRVGHESIDITYRYAHVFPSTQQEVADKLGKLFMNNTQHIEN